MSTSRSCVIGRTNSRNSSNPSGPDAAYANNAEDIEALKLIYHLVKERGMTLQGARQRLKDNRETTLRNFEAVERLKSIREELVAMRDALSAFTYNDVEALRQNIEASQEPKEGAPE